MPRFELALFDWNGTLLDDLHLTYFAITEVFRQYGIAPPSLETCRRELTLHPRFLEFYGRHGLPRNVTEKDIEVAWADAIRERWRTVTLRDRARALLHCCIARNIPRAIISGEAGYRLEARLEEFGLASYFNGVWSGAWCADDRAKERALEEALVRFNVRGTRAFYVDDSVYGIRAAAACDIATFGLTAGYTPAHLIVDAGPTHVVSSLGEVEERIREGGVL